jgi:hypothetical protein
MALSVKKTTAGEPQQAIMAALATEFYPKYVIVVEDDVDVFNLADVMWTPGILRRHLVRPSVQSCRPAGSGDDIFIPNTAGLWRQNFTGRRARRD